MTRWRGGGGLPQIPHAGSAIAYWGEPEQVPQLQYSIRPYDRRVPKRLRKEHGKSNGGSRMGHLGQMPPPHSPCGGAIFLIKTLNFMPGKISLLNSRNIHNLLRILLLLKRTKVKLTMKCVTQHLCAY